MKNKKKDKFTSYNLGEKPDRKTKGKKTTERKKKSEEMEELARTWDEDLCE